MTTSFKLGEICWPKHVDRAMDAVQFIDAVGYCLLFPVKNLPLPSLYYAMARRVPTTWDHYSEKLWDWKANLARHRQAFYGKYFKGRGTFISLEMLPHFLALEESAVAPADHDRLYAVGRISHDARVIWAAIARHGPLATLELRHACGMETKAGNARFKRAMLELQRELLIVHFGTEQETAAWASGRFELTCRAFPREVLAAHSIGVKGARAAVAKKYLRWHPDALPAFFARIFGWPKAACGEAFADSRWRK